MKKLFTPILFSLLATAFCSDETPAQKQIKLAYPGNPTTVLPIMAKDRLPQIDGVINEEEYLHAVKIAGFIQEPGDKGLVPGTSGFVWLGVDPDYIYIAVKTSTPIMDPGGGLATLATKRDSAVYNDDSVEVLINSDANTDRTFHLILNSKGVIFDRTVDYQSGNENVQWDIRDLAVGTNAGSGWWSLEMKIPRSEVGSPKAGMKVNVARNWAGKGASAINPTDSHVGRDRMIAVTFRPDVPVLKMDELGAPDEGDWSVKLRVENVNPQQPCTLAARVMRHSYPSDKAAFTTVEQYQEKTLNASGELAFDLSCENDEIRSFNVILLDHEGKLLFMRTFNARKGLSVGRIPVTASFELPEFGSGGVWYYPGYDKAVAELALKSAIDAQKIDISVRLPNQSVQTVPMNFASKKYSAVLPGGPEAGQYLYDVTITLNNGDQKTFPAAFALEKRKFEWENNNLGKDRVILPPFTPIAATDNMVEMLLRKHVLNAAGLWDSVKSMDKELLAEPMSYTAIIDGRPEKLIGSSTPIQVNSDGVDARAENVLACGSLTLSSSTTIEYDGFFYTRVKIDNPEQRKIDKLTIRIPLKEEEAQLFHAIPDSIRSNPAGNIPAGDGVVWDGSTLTRSIVFGKQLLHPQFVPYIWLGTQMRGICFFMDSSFGTRLDEKIPAMRLIREKGKVILEADIVNLSVIPESGDVFEFGLQATPIKPIDPAMRQMFEDRYGEGVPGSINTFCILDSLLGYPDWFKQPYGQDYDRLNKLAMLARSGEGRAAYEESETQWNKKYRPQLEESLKIYDSPDRNGLNYFQWYESVMANYRAVTVPNAAAGKIVFKYSDPRLIAHIEDIPGYFKSEWSFNPVSYTYAYRSYPVPTNLDYMVYCYNLDLQNGLQGIYLDDMFIIPNDNIHTVAKVDRFGQLHSETGILKLRELVKRIAVLQNKYNCNPRWMQIHMTNALLIPCFSFATSQLGWEDKYGESEFQQRYNFDSIQAINLGLKIGAESVALDGIYRYTTPYEEWIAGKFQYLTRTQLAMVLPHDVKVKRRLSGRFGGLDWPEVQKAFAILNRFGHYEKDCRFVYYFEKDGAINGVPETVLASSYRRPGKALIVLGNTADATEFTIQLDKAKLGVAESARLYDAENGREIIDGKIKLPRCDYKLLLLGDESILEAAARKPGQSLPVDNRFEVDEKQNFKHWRLNFAGASTAPGKGESAGNSFRITGEKNLTTFFANQSWKVRPGDQITVSGNLAGNGNGGFGLYFFGPKYEWIKSELDLKALKKTPEMVESTFTVPAGENIEPAFVALALSAGKDSVITIDNIRAEHSAAIQKKPGVRQTVDQTFEFAPDGNLKAWRQNNGASFQPLGKVKSHGDNRVALTSQSQSTAIYTIAPIAVSPGEILRIGAYISGNGMAGIGFYAYGKEWSWQGAYPGDAQMLDSDGSMTEAEFVVPENVDKACILLYAQPNSNAIFSRVFCEKVPKL